MTGRQYTRIGVPGVFGPTVDKGLPLNETTVADQLKKAGYATAAMGNLLLPKPCATNTVCATRLLDISLRFREMASWPKADVFTRSSRL